MVRFQAPTYQSYIPMIFHYRLHVVTIFLCVLMIPRNGFGFLSRQPTLTKPVDNNRIQRFAFHSTPSKSTKIVADIDIEKLSQLNNCISGTVARNLLTSILRREGASPIYGSISIPPGASEKSISDVDLAIQTKIRNKKYTIMELIELNGDSDSDRTSLAVLCLFVGCSLSAIVVNQNLPGPEIIRFLVVWILSFAPLAFVGYGIATPEKLQTFLVSLQRNIFPTYRKRMIHHEAGHFLMGHLLGLPIKGYASNAVKAAVEFYPLNDPEAGMSRVRQLGFDSVGSRSNDNDMQDKRSDVPFFSREGSGSFIVDNQSVFDRNAKNYTDNPLLQLPSRDEPSMAWPYRGFDEATIDRLAVISVAGVCAEIISFGNAEGGYADFSQLRQLFNSAQTDMDERVMNNRIRFALGYTISQLRLHLGALDALVDIMARDGSVAECVLAIETCPNIRGPDGASADYEVRRREKLRYDGTNPLERLFLGEKTADTEENRVIEGVGGGNQKARFALTGDDPLYAAVAVAMFFLLWATAGGMSLH